MRQEPAEVWYSHPSRLLGTIGLTSAVLVIILVIAMAIWGIFLSDGDRIQGVIALLIATCLCYGARKWIRGWHVYRTTYVVGDTGVRILEAEKEPQHIRWEEFSHGINTRLMPTVVLFSPLVEKPVTFLNNGMQGLSPEFETVRDRAVAKLGKRMRTRWV